VAQRAPWSREFVEQVNAGLTANVNDIEEFSEVVVKIIDNQEVYNQFSRNAISAAKTRFNTETMINGYLEVYEKLM
jgi:glycosyltransferase involved in cell wall biosynthesis